MVSGSISPLRGSFHLPSRYWFTIGRQGVFSLGGGPRIPTGFHVSCGTQDSAYLRSDFRLQDVTFYVGTFQTSSTNHHFKYRSPSTPMINHWFGLFLLRSPLLRKSIFLLFLRVLRCFSSRVTSIHLLYSVHSVGTLLPTGSPFGHRRVITSLAAPRRFSQLTTSFFGSWCQGIHHMPF